MDERLEVVAIKYQPLNIVITMHCVEYGIAKSAIPF